jgi:uncharacterized FlgJ-related protein
MKESNQESIKKYLLSLPTEINYYSLRSLVIQKFGVSTQTFYRAVKSL